MSKNQDERILHPATPKGDCRILRHRTRTVDAVSLGLVQLDETGQNGIGPIGWFSRFRSRAKAYHLSVEPLEHAS